MRWATIAVVVVVAATFALVVRPPIKDPSTAHELIAMQRAIDKVVVRFFGPAQPSLGEISDALRNKQDDAAKVDDANSVRLARILDAHGWPTKKEVGGEAVQAALNVVSRSRDVDLKVRALDLMQKEGVPLTPEYARLVDMVAIAQGVPQTYGTMWTCSDDGHVKLITPLKDPNNVMSLRRKAGLPAAERFASDFCANPGQVRLVKRRNGP
jgi:uncharacterized protein DUF6624